MGSGALLLTPGGAEIGRADLSAPVTFASSEQFQLWRRLREAAPVAWQQLPDGRGFWVVTSYAECKEVLNEHESFTSESGTMLSMLGLKDPAGGRQMLATDPPRHATLRQPLQQALGPTTLRRLDPLIRDYIRVVLAAAVRAPVWDVGATMAVLPVRIAQAIMGLPAPAWDEKEDDATDASANYDEAKRLARWSAMALAPEDPEYAMNGSAEQALAAAHDGLFEFFAAEIDRRRRAGGTGRDDLIGRLLGLRIDGQGLRDADLIANCYSLFLGATVTTGHAVTSTIRHLASEDDLFWQWASDPKLLRSGIEEAIRWSSPVLHVMRYARRRVQLRDAEIAAGDAVTAWLISANRDETRFPLPDVFDPARPQNYHLAFGAGPHFCIGALTSRIVLRVIFEELFNRVGHIEAVGSPQRLHSSFINGIKHLPVIVHPRTGADHGALS